MKTKLNEGFLFKLPCSKRELFLVVVAVAVMSGNTGLIAEDNGPIMTAAWAVVCIALTLRSNGGLPLPREVLVFVLFASLLLVQSVLNDFLPVATVLGFMARLAGGYATISQVNYFGLVYTWCLSWLVLISVPIYLCDLATDGIVRELLLSAVPFRMNATHAIVHNFAEPSRNASLFWEGGAFAGYLILALIFAAITPSQLTMRRRRMVVAILCIGVLSTMSTTGYVALPLVLFMHRDLFGRSKVVHALVVLAMLFGAVQAYQELEFLQSKVLGQIEAAETRREGWELNRFGTIVVDLEYIIERPLVGWGLHSSTRYSLNPGSFTTAQGNGLSDFAAKFGIIGLAAFFYYLTRGFLRHGSAGRDKVACGVIAVVITLFGEAFLTYGLFLGLMFLRRTRDQTAKITRNQLRRGAHGVGQLHFDPVVMRGLK